MERKPTKSTEQTKNLHHHRSYSNASSGSMASPQTKTPIKGQTRVLMQLITFFELEPNQCQNHNPKQPV